MRNFKIVIVVLLGMMVINQPVAAAVSYDIAVLQGLDKVTARVFTFEAPINSIIKFGTLEIIVRKCHKRPPEEPPESAAFLEVSEVRLGELIVNVYTGWMFASSPALAAMEHPVYDVWVLNCLKSRVNPPKI